MKAEYESLAKTSRIVATSRASIKIRDSYYTVEFQEERIIPDTVGVDIEAEKKFLWDAVNSEVDEQIQEIIDASRN